VWARTGYWRTDLHIYRQERFIDTARRGKMVFSGRGTCHMSFKVGDTVVYPHHGAARIEAVETRTIKGEDRTYLVLKVDKGDLTVRVPADNAELVGVRDVVGAEGLERVFEVLRAPHTEEPTNWSRRYKANLEKLASGDVNKVAEVVRDLWRRDRERGLSAGEKRMLAKARQILVSELALAEKTNEDKAEALLDEVLANLLRSRASGLGGRSAEPAPGAPGRLGCRRAPAHQFPGAVSGWPVLAG
jgi:CarD family transcriptional regulator